MSLTRQVAHNTIIQIVGKSISALLSLVAVGIIARYLGQEGFGAYSIILAFLQVFGFLVDFGLTLIALQMISETDDQNRVNQIMSNILTFRVISAAVFLGMAPLVVLLFPYPPMIKLGVAVTALAFFFLILNQTLNGTFQKNLRMDKPAIAEVVSRALFVVLVALAAWFRLDLLAIMWAVVISSFFYFLIDLLFGRKFVRIVPAFDFILWKEIISRSWPIGISITFNLIYLKADIIILSLFRPISEVGLYGASYKVVDGLTVLPMMFMGLILPVLAASWAKKNLERFRRVFKKTFDFLILGSVPLVIGTFFVGEKLMTLIAGADFVRSGGILKVLIIGTALLFIGSLPGHAIVALGKQKIMAWGYLADAILALIGYLIFIPLFSYWGAAWVTVFSEGFIAVLTFAVVYRTAQTKIGFSVFGKALLASLAMGGIIYLLKDLHVLLLLLVAAVVYGIFIILIKGVSKEEILEIIRIKKVRA